jgi:glycosyltransferase involved in cell wall biosynthesis
MNVCMVAYTFYEGDNRVMRYAEALTARGDRVDVIALRQPHEPDTYRVINGVHVYRVQPRAYDERGLRSYAFRIASFFARAFWLLAKRHRKLRYDLIHVHSVPDPLVFAALVPKFMGAKVILDIHDLLPELFTAKFVGRSHRIVHRALVVVERLCARFADHVITANDLWREKVIARKSVTTDKCTAFLNFPDPNIFHARTTFRNSDKFTIMYPGTLSWHQGLDVAIRALSAISLEVPQTEFHIYGDGSAKAELVQLTNTLGLSTKVIFHKCIPLRDMADIMRTADLAVVPKRNDLFGDEAFSTKTLEFMMVGVPLVLADTKVDRYYFNDSVVRFFTSGDEKALAAAILELIRNGSDRATLVRNAQEFVKDQSWEVHKHRYFNLVDSLCTGSNVVHNFIAGDSVPTRPAGLAARCSSVEPPNPR